MATTTATTETFDKEVLESELPVLVDFWAAWCGPCRAVAPVLEKLSEDREGKLRVVKVNVDENPELAAAYNVTSIPNMTLFKDGEAVHQIIGAAPQAHIEKEIEGLY